MVVTLVVRVEAVAVVQCPCSIGTVIVRTEYVQHAAGYFKVKVTSSSQTGVHLECCLLKLLKLHVHDSVFVQHERSWCHVVGVPSIFDLCRGCTFNLWFRTFTKVPNTSSSTPHDESSYVQQTSIVYCADASLRLRGHGARDSHRSIYVLSDSVLVVSINRIVLAFPSSTSAVTALGCLAGKAVVLCRGWTSHA